MCRVLPHKNWQPQNKIKVAVLHVDNMTGTLWSSHIPDEKGVSDMKSNHQMFSTGGMDGWARDYLLCCLRYLIASSMQILEAMEGPRDTCIVYVQWGHRELCLTKNFELSLVPIITHWRSWRPEKRLFCLATIVYEFDVRLAHTSLPGTKWTQEGKLLIASVFSQHQ